MNGEQGLARDCGSDKRRGGRQQQNAPASIRQPDEQPERKEDAEKPHASDTLQQHVEIQAGAAPEIDCVRFQKGLRGPSPLIVQQGEEFPFCVELGGSAELGHHLARDPVDSHAGPLRTLAVARIRDFPKHGDHAQFFQ
jgi:hypothetical protein